jgi:broad specificity phosphatase PhoE
MTTIHLIRHGQASIGTSNYDVLSALGRKQSQVLAAHLEQTGLRFDHVFSGTLQRQIDTAEIAVARPTAPPVQRAAFNEYQHSRIFDHYAPCLAQQNDAAGEWAARGHNTKMTYELFSGLMTAWMEDNTKRDDFESWDQFNQRIESGIQAIIRQTDRQAEVAIFTSGGVICTILQKILHFRIDKLLELNWGVYNTGITTIKVQNTSLKLSAFNNIAHLELKKDRALITNI